MTQDEIDTMWQKAMHQSIKEGEMFTRYQFAHLVADKATEEANARANASWTLMCKKMVAIEREALTQPEQEPVATLEDLEQEIYENTRQFVSHDVMEWMLKRYYTTPPQRTWVGLTDKEAMQICVDCGCLSEDWLTLLDAIEAKLKQKNA